jgi:hypothetical protein
MVVARPKGAPWPRVPEDLTPSRRHAQARWARFGLARQRHHGAAATLAHPVLAEVDRMCSCGDMSPFLQHPVPPQSERMCGCGGRASATRFSACPRRLAAPPRAA